MPCVSVQDIYTMIVVTIQSCLNQSLYSVYCRAHSLLTVSFSPPSLNFCYIVVEIAATVNYCLTKGIIVISSDIFCEQTKLVV